MEGLGGPLPDEARRLIPLANRKDIGVPQAESAGDFIDHGRQATVGLVAVVEADRIEDVAQHPRHRQQSDRPLADVDFGAAQPGLDLRPQVFARAVAVIAIVKGQEVVPAA